jgi:hypothetical protein
MKKVHVVIAVVLIALAATIGFYALTSTTHLGVKSQASPQSVSTLVSQGNRRLSATQAAIRRALAQRPPSVGANGSVPFVPPHQVVVNVSGSPSAQPYVAPVVSHGYDEGGD